MVEKLGRAECGAMLLEKGIWHIEGYKPVELKAPVDWFMDPYQSRTWQWRLHLFDFIPPLLAFDTREGGVRGAELACQLVKNWWEDNRDRKASAPMAWHDHATALRVDNLINLKDAEPTDLWFRKNFTDVLAHHASILATDWFYRKDTNHGLDQALALYAISHLITEYPSSCEHRRLSIERINYEIGRAFCADGGHVENSVDYQRYGLNQVRKIFERAERYEGVSHSIGLPRGTLNAAIVGLTHMISPHGYAPAIGDTRYTSALAFVPPKDPIKHAIDPEKYQNLVFACSGGQKGSRPSESDIALLQSGWASLRESWDEDAIHCLFKCGFLSEGHRRDDDTGIYVHAHRKEWLIAGGIFKYDFKHPIRVHMESHEAATLSFPRGAVASRKLGVQSRIAGFKSNSHEATVVGETDMFAGYHSRREITLDRAMKKLIVRDTLRPTGEGDGLQNRHAVPFIEEGEYVSRFLVPGDREVRVLTSNHVTVSDGARVMHIEKTKRNDCIQMHKGEMSPRPAGWRSLGNDHVEPAWAIDFVTRGESLDTIYIIHWTPVA